jgi:hypothetical protein
MKPKQLEIVRGKLESEGSISRNWCLRNYISRLGALVAKLKEKGWQITGAYVPYIKENGETGKDYVYTLVMRPSN